MKGIDAGKDKVKKICDLLKKETLEPAKKEADSIISHAEEQAKKIIEQARREEEKIRAEFRKEIEKEKGVFQSSLNQACKQSLEILRQDIEKKLFQPELSKILSEPLKEPKVIADLIKVIIQSLEKEGLAADLTAMIPQAVSVDAVNQLLVKNVLEKLKTGGVTAGSIRGGTSVKVEKDNITIDVTDEALKELVSAHIQKGFQEIIFRS